MSHSYLSNSLVEAVKQSTVYTATDHRYKQTRGTLAILSSVRDGEVKILQLSGAETPIAHSKRGSDSYEIEILGVMTDKAGDTHSLRIMVDRAYMPGEGGEIRGFSVFVDEQEQNEKAALPEDTVESLFCEWIESEISNLTEDSQPEGNADGTLNAALVVLGTTQDELNALVKLLRKGGHRCYMDATPEAAKLARSFL